MTHATSEPSSSGPALSVQPAAPEPDEPRDAALPASPLGNLQRRHQEYQERLQLDIRVPEWGEDPDEDPRVSIYTRHRPLRPSELNDINEHRRGNGKGKHRSKDWLDLANADALARTCEEVWAVVGEPPEFDGDGQVEIEESARLSLRPNDWHGTKTRLDGDLADQLGMMRAVDGRPPTAVEVVRKLYLTDGGVSQAVNRLMAWSKLTAPDTERDFTAG